MDGKRGRAHGRLIEKESCFVKNKWRRARDRAWLVRYKGTCTEEAWPESPLGRNDGLGVRREAMIGSIQYIWTINQFCSFLSKDGSRAETGGEGLGLDEVELRVSDEGGV